MKFKNLLVIAIAAFFTCFHTFATTPQRDGFDVKKDLLLVQFDSKTDVDDIHTAAALITLMSASEFSKVNYYAVAGTYGIQEGLYVPPNDLFQLIFKDNWADAHGNPQLALEQVMKKVKKALSKNGDVWVAEAGQSDFTAKVVKAIQEEMPEVDVAQRVHVVQHSNWNEESTSPESLQFVKSATDYNKIPDGNTVGNGSPGFRSAEYQQWNEKVTDPQLTEIWKLAMAIGKEYNGKDGRYNNEAVAKGGLDFSDLAEVCYILGVQDINDVAQFFDQYGK